MPVEADAATEDAGGADDDGGDDLYNLKTPKPLNTPASPAAPPTVHVNGSSPPPSSATPAAAPKPNPSPGRQQANSQVEHWVANVSQQAPLPPSTPAGPIARRPSESTSANPFKKRRPSVSSQKSKDGDEVSRAPSITSTDGRFSLKDLLGGGPKLARKNSASSRKSASSKVSESGKAASTNGESALMKKYGICGKLAIGKGATSVVRLAHKWDRAEEKLYAVKQFRERRKNESQKEYVKKLTAEFCISSTLHHPNIVETVDLLQDESDKWCEVMEFCPGGDLYAALRRGTMSQTEIECCFKQICLGLGYLHGQGVAHRDIKPENLFFDARGQLKIGDYGASTVFRLPWETTVHKSSGLCGSEPYIAPEQFAHPASYDARLVDIWATGVVYYCMSYQELPWGSAQPSDKLYSTYAAQCLSPQFSVISVPLPKAPQQRLSERAQRAEREKEDRAKYPATIQNLKPRTGRPILRRMLEPNPDHRVVIEDIIATAWFQEIQICNTPGVADTHVHPSALAAASISVADRGF